MCKYKYIFIIQTIHSTKKKMFLKSLTFQILVVLSTYILYVVSSIPIEDIDISLQEDSSSFVKGSSYLSLCKKYKKDRKKNYNNGNLWAVELSNNGSLLIDIDIVNTLCNSNNNVKVHLIFEEDEEISKYSELSDIDTEKVIVNNNSIEKTFNFKALPNLKALQKYFKDIHISSNREYRRKLTYEYLVNKAKKSQLPFLRHLMKDNNDRENASLQNSDLNSRFEYESFWITNSIYFSSFSVELCEEVWKYFTSIKGESRQKIRLLKSSQIKQIQPVFTKEKKEENKEQEKKKQRSATTTIKTNKTLINPAANETMPAWSTSLAWNIKRIGADQVWDKGITGKGIVVATIDGGVSYTHEALVENYRGTTIITIDDENNDSKGKKPSKYEFDHNYNWVDYAYKSKEPEDSDGHGTNVQGIATGSKTSGVGVAVESKWISAKVFNYAGFADDKWIIEAAQWVICPSPLNSSKQTQKDTLLLPYDVDTCKPELGADVISCSWGLDSAKSSQLSTYINAWITAGSIPVFAVGNDGPACNTVYSPADYTGVISVGGTDKSDEIASWSSRGPGPQSLNDKHTIVTESKPIENEKEGTFLKSDIYSRQTPTIVAPGMNIEGPSCSDDTEYTGFSGTSQACPHVAGVAALLLSMNQIYREQQKIYDEKFDHLFSSEAVIDSIYSSADVDSLQEPTTGSDSCGNIAWNKFPNFIYGYGRLSAINALSKQTEKFEDI